MWRLNPTADISGTSLVVEIGISPAFLVARFGPPLPTAECRVTGRYVFTNHSGVVFTIYDWKSTSAYLGDDEDAPSPDEFWESVVDEEMSVGGRGDYEDGSAGDFVVWLRAEQAQWIALRN